MAGVTVIETETLVFAQTDTSKTANLSGAIDDYAKCCLFFSSRMTEDNSADMSDWAEHSLRGDITSAPAIVIDRTLGETEVTVEATAVQFGSGVNVYPVPFTLNEGAITVTAGSFTAVTLANTFVNVSYKQASHPSGRNSLTGIRVRLNTTSITADRNQESLALTDIRFNEQSGSSVRITSVLAGLPRMQIGDRFAITNHTDGANNDTYTVTTVTTNDEDYTADSDGTPVDNDTDQTADAEVQGPQIDGIAYVCESSAGADFTVQHINGTLASSSSSVDLTIPTTVDTAKSFLLCTWHFEETETSDNNDNCPYVKILDGDNVRVKRDGTTDDVEVYAQVIEFDSGGAETVQRGDVIDASVDAGVSDLVVTIVSGQQCDITSAGANLPTVAVGQGFWINQAAGGENEDIWEVDTITTQGEEFRATKQNSAPTTRGPFDDDIETEILCGVGHSQQNDNPEDVDITDVDIARSMAVIPGPQSYRRGQAAGVNQADIGDTFYMAELITSGADVRITRGRVGSERLTESSWEVIQWELDAGGGPTRRVMVTG